MGLTRVSVDGERFNSVPVFAEVRQLSVKVGIKLTQKLTHPLPAVSGPGGSDVLVIESPKRR